MKVVGFFVVMLGLVIAWIGITGSQHNVMNIIRNVHIPNPSGVKLSSPSPTKKAAPKK